jgi:hypothetical protein
MLFSLKPVSVIVLCGFIFGGCAKDQSMDDYRSQKAAQDASVNQQAAGNQTGVATLQSDGSVVGAAKLSLTATSVSQTSSDGLAQEARSTISGSLDINGLVNSHFSFTDGLYDSNAHTLTITSTVPDLSDASGKTTKQVHLGGSLRNGIFDGVVYFGGDEANTIHLVTSVAGTVTPSAVQTSGLRYKQFSFLNQVFTGSIVEPAVGSGKSQSVPVTLKFINRAGATPQEDFFNLLSTERAVQLTLSEDLTGNIPYSLNFTGVLDEKQGILNAATAPTPAGAVIRLVCRLKDFGGGKTGWNCNLIQSLDQPPFDMVPVTP